MRRAGTPMKDWVIALPGGEREVSLVGGYVLEGREGNGMMDKRQNGTYREG